MFAKTICGYQLLFRLDSTKKTLSRELVFRRRDSD